MVKSVLLATGADAAFYPLMEEALKSLLAQGVDTRAEIGILDFGLDGPQRQVLSAQGCNLQEPKWTLSVPSIAKSRLDLTYLARSALREYFPGFKTYIWFDADAWAQTPDFFTALVQGAAAKGLAAAHENGAGYRRGAPYRHSWPKDMRAIHGLLKGFGLGRQPPVNGGIVALSDTAPHWGAWAKHMEHVITKTRRLSLLPAALTAAVTLDNLPLAPLPARCNWLCCLSAPAWDAGRKLFCEPARGGAPLSVLHLAGPGKHQTYKLPQVAGGSINTPLTYGAFKSLR